MPWWVVWAWVSISLHVLFVLMALNVADRFEATGPEGLRGLWSRIAAWGQAWRSGRTVNYDAKTGKIVGDRVAAVAARTIASSPSNFWRESSRALLLQNSWSGSMFEYLMPPLVMKEPQGGILNTPFVTQFAKPTEMTMNMWLETVVEDDGTEVDELELRLEGLDLPEEARKEVDRELGRPRRHDRDAVPHGHGQLPARHRRGRVPHLHCRR